MKEIQLANGKGVALVDDDDYDFLMQYKWHIHVDTSVKNTNLKYAHTNIWIGDKRTAISMHVLLMKPAKGEYVDHKDRDGLNNQRDNMRLVTPSQSAANRDTSGSRTVSQYKGVRFDNRRRQKKCWYAESRLLGQRVRTKMYATELEAAEAYDCLVILLFGEHALLNFPDNDYSDMYETERRWTREDEEEALRELEAENG